MRLSRLLLATMREEPSGGHPPGFKRLIRAGYIRATPGGVSLLPLGVRLMQRVGAALALPLEDAGWAQILIAARGPSAVRQRGRAPGPAVGEQVWSPQPPPPTLAALIDSYKRLPLKAYQAVWRDQASIEGDPFPSNLRRILQAWLLADPAEAEGHCLELETTVLTSLRSLGLNPATSGPAAQPTGPIEVSVRSDESGADRLGCSQCGFLASQAAAGVVPSAAEATPQLPMERVATPGADTILGLCTSLGIAPERTAKVMLFAGKPAGVSEDQVLMVLVRGEREVSWRKVAWASGWRDLRWAEAAEVARIGAVSGYASPVGLAHAWVLVDRAVAESTNLVTGANESGFHLCNTTCGRDYTPWRVADLASAVPGDLCPRCGAGLEKQGGVLLGMQAVLLPEASDPIGKYTDRGGATRPLAGLYLEIDLTTLIAVLAQQQADGRGLAWRPAAAPFVAHVIGVPPFEEQALGLYSALRAQGVDALLDDREVSPGVKMKDADLIGMPVRIAVSQQSTAGGGAEVTGRRSGESRIVPIEAVASEVERQMS